MTKNVKGINPKSFRNVLLSFLILLLLVVVGSIIWSRYSLRQEQDGIAEFRTSIKSAQSSFNEVSSNWAYDEHCTGYGSDVTRNNKIVCYVTLVNNTDTNSQNYDRYLAKLASAGYKLIRPTEVLPAKSNNIDHKTMRITSYEHPFRKDCICNFTGAESSQSSTGMTEFSCSFNAPGYYFVRRN